MSESEFDIYLKWKEKIDPSHSPRKVLALFRRTLADMRISNVSTIQCVEYLASRGYTIRLETVRRWYRDNCKTDADAYAILNSVPTANGGISSNIPIRTAAASTPNLHASNSRGITDTASENQTLAQKKEAEKQRILGIARAALKKIEENSPDAVIRRGDLAINKNSTENS